MEKPVKVKQILSAYVTFCCLQTRTVYKSVQAWMPSILFGSNKWGQREHEYSPDNFTVLEPRAQQITSRIEKAIRMNVTGQYSR